MRKMFLKTVALLMCIVLLLTGCNADDFKDEVLEMKTNGDPRPPEIVAIRFEHSIYSLEEEIYFTLSFGLLDDLFLEGESFGKASLYWYWYTNETYHFIRETEEEFTKENFGVSYSLATGDVFQHSEQLRMPTELFPEGVGTVDIKVYVSENGGFEDNRESEYGYYMGSIQFGYRKEANTIKLAKYAWQLEDKESN